MQRGSGRSHRGEERRSPVLRPRKGNRQYRMQHQKSCVKRKRNHDPQAYNKQRRKGGKRVCFVPTIRLTGDQALELYKWLDAAIRYQDGRLRPLCDAKARWPREVLLREYQFVHKCQECDFNTPSETTMYRHCAQHDFVHMSK